MKPEVETPTRNGTWGTALKWWLFEFQSWPMGPLREFGWEILEAIITVLRLIWFLLLLPFWPVILGLALCWKPLRDRINECRERGDRPCNRIEGRFTVRWR